MEVVGLLIMGEVLFFGLLLCAIAFLPYWNRPKGYGRSVICTPCKEGNHRHCDPHYWSPTSNQHSCPCHHKTEDFTSMWTTSDLSDFPEPSPNGQCKLF